jgi:amino acid permease
MKPRDMYVTWGGQRYVLVLLITVLCSFLLWQGKLTSADYALIIVSVVIAYITGRTYQNTKIGKEE